MDAIDHGLVRPQLESSALTKSSTESSLTTVYCVSFNQPPSVIAAAKSMLTRDELVRADRFIVEPPRLQFILCRAALRTLIARQLECTPMEVRFQLSSLGKPFVTVNGALRTQFNVSHSGEFGLIAISNETVGVDIEKLQPRINPKSLLSQVVSPDELTNWSKLTATDHATQIIRLWVCKEAILKAMGLGIAECLKQISFSLPIESGKAFQLSRIDSAVQMHLEEPADCRCNPWLTTSYWSIQPLKVHADYYAAVATTQKCSQVELADFKFESVE